MEEISCCFTGYRPQKLPFKVSREDSGYTEFENMLINEIMELTECGCTTFISGMAMGFDIIAAECVLDARELIKDTSIKLICAIPFIDQSEKYPAFWKEKYDRLLEECDEAVLISDKYFRSCYMKRNMYMVDNSDVVMTYYDGLPGGTKNTMEYALKKGRKIINLYEKEIP